MGDAKYIRQHGLSVYFSDKLEKTFYALLTNITTQKKAELIYKMINKSLNLILKVSVYGFIGLSVMKGNLTVGIFTLLIQYSEKLMTSFNVLYEESLYIQDRLVAIDKIKKYYSIYSYEDKDSVTDDISQINIEDLDFGFDDNKIFNDYSLEIKKGEIYNLKGDNGSGKSTLINIILGLYMGDYKGKISYNGKSLDSLNITQINLHKIGLTEQEPNLLDESIRYNVTLTEDATNDEKIMDLARIVNLDEFILSLENKLSTKVEQSSANLSGGQKQKISIMKALYKNPDVLILDEPTSALDANSRDKLKNYLQETKEEIITIIVTHDKDFAGIADRFISFCS